MSRLLSQCEFVKLPNGRWKCFRCGFVSHKAMDASPRRNCRLVETVKTLQPLLTHWLTCKHRDPTPIATTTGTVAGCGCGATVVEFFQCRHFREPVLKQCAGWAAESNRDKLRAACPGYASRTCRECPVPKESKPQQPVAPSPAKLSPVANLVAITAYFNPQHSSRRRDNWYRFAEGLADKGINLLTVEGIRDGDLPDLPAVHSVRQVAFRDVLWQKERLLNLLIESLSADVDAVSWIDADLLFELDEPRQKVLDALTRWPIIQPWSTTWMQNADGEIQYWGDRRTIVSLASTNRGQPGKAHPDKRHPGFAWAARRETLTAMGGFYDRHVTGGGDTAMAFGFYGDFDSSYLTNEDRMNAEMRAHWLEWAKRAYAAIGGRVGFIEGKLHHLYHGEIKDRGYKYRWTKLASHGYDPERHVRISESGALEWTEEAPQALREYVADYLLNQRKEP